MNIQELGYFQEFVELLICIKSILVRASDVSSRLFTMVYTVSMKEIREKLSNIIILIVYAFVYITAAI